MGSGVDPTTLAIFAVAFLVAGAGMVLAHGLADGDRRRVKARIARAGGQHVRRDVPAGGTEYESLRRDQSSAHVRQLDAVARRVLPRPQALRERLTKTGRRITIGQYALVCCGIALFVTLLRSLFFDMPLLVAVLFGIVSGVGLPHYAISMLIRRRLKRFTAQFAEAIDLIVRGLKSGLPTTESIRAVGAEFRDPIGIEFRRISDSIHFGQPLEEALDDAVKRIDTPEFRFFTISLAVQRETGGNLAETLENLSDILRKRRQMHLKIKAMSSEAKASAMILGSLPFVMFGLIHLVNRGYVTQLFEDPRGLMMVAAGLISLGLGVAVMMKMVRFEI